MKIIRYDLPAITTTTTNTTLQVDNGDTVISVSDSSSFSAGDIVLFELRGHEFGEVKYIDTVDSPTSITLTTALEQTHITDCVITILNYDKFKVTRSDTVSGTYVTLTESELDYANQYGKIEYVDDSSGSADTKFYKVSYVNTILASDDLQATLNNQNDYGYVTLDEVRAAFNIDSTQLTDQMAFDSINSGVEFIKDKVYNVQTLSLSGDDTVFNLNLNHLFIADWQANRQVTKDDIVVYEVDSVTNSRIYVPHKVVKLLLNDPRIIFNERMPRNGRQLVAEIPSTFKKFEDMRSSLKMVNKLLAANYLLANTTNENIVDGVTSWTAGGTSINSDLSTSENVIDNNEKRAKKIIDEIISKVYVHRTKLRTTYSSLNRSPRGGSVGFLTQGGNNIRW